MTSVTKSVVPVAGLGTRFLPATKAIPKVMLPVVDTPAIQYVVEEAAAAGLSDVLLVTGRGQSSVSDHFDSAPEVERVLEAKGDQKRLDAVRASSDLAQVHVLRQGAPLGLGHAVLTAAAHVGDEPFAVQLGDDLIDARDPILPTMLAVQEALGGSVIALMEVPPSQTSLYGCAAVEAVAHDVTDRFGDDVVRVQHMVEKPEPADAPSNLAMIGRYVLAPEIFDVLRTTEPGRGGEIQLTDALQEMAQRTGTGGGVHGVIFRGRRYDTGDRLDYLKAVVQLGSDHPELGEDFHAWLREYVAGR
ncbi:UTP--glucose-1-phosphate uridylyltransferase [Ruania halotolerans]|uniref:UTP--glucose-1-phosphate uridylyltransferase n=1 Tax=Ruania halotolerans TaxID=2897773 RepID=UPI001E3DF7BA|nr:UTP--glucose-1-phosphate uridylyltransferase [Ruania halotolerans]UFU07307.1 UTP--glucose-1-phosphate uridylyltransferase [Ruania halotolerans]